MTEFQGDTPRSDAEREALFEPVKEAMSESMQDPEVHQAMIEAVRRNFPHPFNKDVSGD